MENSDGVGKNKGGTCGNGVGSNNGGTGGTVEDNMNGGGDMVEREGDPRRREELLPNRRTLRGKRRGKKNISVEEQQRLACAMQRWLGKQILGPKSHH